jgi:4-aminobutyrate aminotransferase-like enzyme
MYGQLPIFWDKAEDVTIYDRHGNKFLDFTSTICVANIGHGNKLLIDCIDDILRKPLLHTYTFPHQTRLQFLRLLNLICSPFCEKAFLVSAGTEATEVACKLMKMYTKRNILWSFTGAMHGRTQLAEQLKGDYTWAINDNHVWHLSIPTKDITWEKTLFGINSHFIDNCAGIMIESYRGRDAYFFTKKYIHDLVKWAHKHKILVCFDEIQSGFGRTGKLFAFEHYEVKPDLICIGKALSPAIPLSAVIGKKEILDTPEIGSMSSTHSANPLACASGIASLLQIVNLIDDINRKGKILYRELKKTGLEIQGKGLVYAILTKTEKQATDIVWKAFKKGLLTIWTHKNSVKIAPPLTITNEAIKEGCKILQQITK